MSEPVLQISGIEKLLVANEVAVLISEIQRGLHIVYGAFQKYAPQENSRIPLTREDMGIINDFIRAISPISVSYYAGLALAPGFIPTPPDEVKKLVLNYVSRNFLARINGLAAEADEIRQIAEQAAHYAMES